MKDIEGQITSSPAAIPEHEQRQVQGSRTTRHGDALLHAAIIGHDPLEFGHSGSLGSPNRADHRL